MLSCAVEGLAFFDESLSVLSVAARLLERSEVGGVEEVAPEEVALAPLAVVGSVALPWLEPVDS